MRFFLSGLVVLITFQSAYLQNNVALPRDESSQDPTLSTFVRDLKKAILAKDEKWIYSVLDADVVSTYGDEPGIVVFKNYWTPENDSTDFWPYLKNVVSMGGVFLHDTADETGKYQFVFPYAYDIEMGIEDDYYLLGVITGKNVNLRKDPNIQSEVITQLSHDVIFFLYEDDETTSNVGLNPYGEPEWYQITTYDKQLQGWVNWQYVYSLLGPRLFLFKDKKGQWKISAFVAGD
ncbi:MAG TPA: SH3 domain-containing protein [Saprospiraceae bacterium]|nr:SH3 domain-containing protein [Saprospiraceae bacterium]